MIGGLASAAAGPGGNRLVLDDRLHTDGAVGALLPPGVAVSIVVSQGCRPVGQPYTVTRAEGHLLQELGGRPALARLQDLVTTLPAEDRELLAQGVHLGRVIDEHKLDFERGDFLIRGVLGADPNSGALAVGDELETGATVQFQVRDAVSADDDLRAMLAGREADGALVFTCNGRGMGLFGAPDHDASVVSELTGSPALAGMFCAGELGPVGGRTFLHGFTASMALFRDGLEPLLDRRQPARPTAGGPVRSSVHLLAHGARPPPGDRRVATQRRIRDDGQEALEDRCRRLQGAGQELR